MGNNLGKVNIPGIVAGVLALVSLLSPWWGIVTNGFSISVSCMFGPLFMPGHTGQGINDGFVQALNTYSPIILALSLATVSFSLIGSFTRSMRPLVAGLFFAVSSVVGYAVLLNYALSQNCQGNNNCVRELTGSSNFLNITTTWGFQTGFYLFVAGAVALIVALAYHEIAGHSN